MTRSLRVAHRWCAVALAVLASLALAAGLFERPPRVTPLYEAPRR